MIVPETHLPISTLKGSYRLEKFTGLVQNYTAKKMSVVIYKKMHRHIMLIFTI